MTASIKELSTDQILDMLPEGVKFVCVIWDPDTKDARTVSNLDQQTANALLRTYLRSLRGPEWV